MRQTFHGFRVLARVASRPALVVFSLLLLMLAPRAVFGQG